MIPVNVVTGFLGSGKTTLLREILRDPAFSDSAVIVNEFGEVGLDHMLLEEVEEGVLLLESGCICCTVRSDLQDTIRDLHDKAARGAIPPFKRVIVETTGVADPAPIVSTIAAEPVIRQHFRIGNVVCTVDGMNGLATLAAHPEPEKQIAVADRILVTKADIAEPAALAALEARVQALNPVTPLARSTGQGFDADFLFGADLGDAARRDDEVNRWLALAEHGHDDHHHHHHDHAHGHGHTSGTTTFVLRFPERIDWTAFGVWLTALLHAHGEKILRVKGILNVLESDTPVVIHGVQHVVHPPLHLARWPDDDRSSRIVFIARGVEADLIRRSLSAYLIATSKSARPDPVA
ncbi:cobalamin synthesis protein/P47K family protein [Oceanicola granulosus HTCC2516]|uniref:Cobalamin synthesis protein/P47K family protein n=1 Tax=Oceanicola granulosus (strain ATCC BAA-861 / DSM 15982 / KCTC 12143 / HTCC2516) TaxID=314256 RepID=Q2CBM4_OCEGH|nr:GTP-binding protein [Oceanicola granulosus]EAR50107.1 cobalamin synthesis protein/P47K family protein [Oceanicola granulosus HTCC2516]